MGYIEIADRKRFMEDKDLRFVWSTSNPHINLALRAELDQQTIDINRLKTENKLSLNFTAGLGGTPADLTHIGLARLFAGEVTDWSFKY